MLELFVPVLSTLVTLFLGYTAYVSDRDNISNKLFLYLTGSISLWSLFSYLSSVNSPGNILLVRIVMFFVVLMNTIYSLLIRYFPESDGALVYKKEKLKLLFTVLVLATTVSPFLFTRLTYAGDNISPVAGPGMVFFLLHVGYFVIYSTTVLFRRVKQATGSTKSQLKILALGAFILFFVTPLLNFVLPLVASNSQVIRYSPVIMALFASILFYSMIRHRLFNMKSAAARASSYFVVISIVTVFNAALVFALRYLLFPELQVDKLQILANVVVTTLLIFLFPLMKKWFDKFTNKLFFRDVYSSQDLIGELNQTLVSNVDLESLLRNSAVIIEKNLQSSSTGFYLRETSYFGSRVIGSGNKNIRLKDIDTIQYSITKLHGKVHSINREPKSIGEAELKDIMRQNDIEVIARLVSTLDYEVKGIGYLFLGPKKSGMSYTQQDFKVIEIISNELVIAIQNALRFEEIEQFNVTLQKKIDDATRELKASNEKLKALDEAKDEFVSMASHQLRTPLTSVKGYLSMVLEEDAGKINDMQKQMLGQALFSSQRMVYLIADLLNVSRLKTGKFTIESKPVYLPDIVETELQQLKDGATAKNITFEFEKPKKFATIDLDETKIRQVIMNFVDNALYYTKTNGKITIELKEKKDSVEFAVKDNGMGVPKDEQHKLFAKFYRAENARKARPDGTGLGLFMAKKVVVAQGGSIIFQSKEGKGSTFGFSFPKNRTMSTTAASDDETTQKA